MVGSSALGVIVGNSGLFASLQGQVNFGAEGIRPPILQDIFQYRSMEDGECPY